MKKIYSLIVSLHFCFLVAAQGNLQFNQVLTFNGNFSYNIPNFWGPTIDGPSWTVPSGKVWKIENKTRTPRGNLTFVVNNIAINDFYMTTNINNNALSTVIDNSPIWLKENDIIKFVATGNCQNGNCNVNENYFISIIEFNVIP